MKESPETRRDKALRQRIIGEAGKIFIEEGSAQLSMRRVAQEVGCSQMAAYRHFANKEALMQHLCAQLYLEFTGRMFRRMERAAGPRQQLSVFVAALLEFAETYPDHYSLIFLTRNSDPSVISEREQLGESFLETIHELLRKLLPADTPVYVSNTRLRQVLTCLHGTAALMIAHPKAYGLTRQRATKETEDAIVRLLNLT